MQKKETAIEVKVGALVLFSTALLVAFVLVLGDFSFREGFQFHVQFDNAGGLKPGADVAIAGLNVGSVTSLEFIKNENPATADMSAVAVQATIRLDPRYADAVRHNSRFYITTRGVLGEPYIEVVTRSLDAKPVASGDILRGVDPPRMEIMLARLNELLDTVTTLLDDPDVKLKELVANTSSLFGNLDDIVVRNRDAIDGAVAELHTTTSEASKLLATINSTLDDGRQLRTILNDTQATASNARRLMGRLDSSLDPIVDDATATLGSARRIATTAERALVDREDKILAAIDNLHKSSEDLATVSSDARILISRVSEGEGTVGSLLVEREIYEDLKELLRVIKQQPWKILWKE